MMKDFAGNPGLLKKHRIGLIEIIRLLAGAYERSAVLTDFACGKHGGTATRQLNPVTHCSSQDVPTGSTLARDDSPSGVLVSAVES